jgi:hypothetical protein
MFKEVKKALKNVWSKIARLLTNKQMGGGGQTLCHRRKGAILVEFAIAIPTLIAVLYYAHDLPRYRRLQSRMEFCGHCLINILQNMSQNRTDKKIKTIDVWHAMQAAYLSVFSGDSMFKMGYRPMIFIYYVKGLPNNKASVCWYCHCWNGSTTGISKYVQVYATEDQFRSLIMNYKDANPEDLYKDLHIQDGDVNIILEATLTIANVANTSMPLNRRFGFWIIPIKDSKKPGQSGNRETFFQRVIIFTPKPGLFDESPPG